MNKGGFVGIQIVRFVIMPFLFALSVRAGESRVVRIAFSDSRFACIKVNTNATTNVPIAQLTNFLTVLALKQPDLVLVNSDKAPSVAPEGSMRHLFSLCDTQRVALYLYPSDDGPDMFKVQVYHWVTPEDKGAELSAAEFFSNGDSLGAGKAGFLKLVADIRARHHKHPLILGCHIKDPSHSDLVVPFYEHEEALTRALGSRRMILSDMTGLQEP